MSKLDKQNKITFITMMGYWGKILRVGPIVIIVEENLKDLMAYVYRSKGVQYCHFCPKDLRGLSQAEFVASVFHELAHLKRKAFWETVGKEEAEYIAETQALIWLKKYNRKYYDQYVEQMRKEIKTPHYAKKHGFYEKAFARIKEYRS